MRLSAYYSNSGHTVKKIGHPAIIIKKLTADKQILLINLVAKHLTNLQVLMLNTPFENRNCKST